MSVGFFFRRIYLVHNKHLSLEEDGSHEIDKDLDIYYLKQNDKMKKIGTIHQIIRESKILGTKETLIDAIGKKLSDVKDISEKDISEKLYVRDDDMSINELLKEHGIFYKSEFSSPKTKSSKSGGKRKTRRQNRKNRTPK